MAVVGMILMGVGYLVALIFGIIILINAFKESVWWGLGSLFVPFVSLIYVFMHWDKNKKPFLYSLAMIPVVLLGVFLAGSSVEGMIPATA